MKEITQDLVKHLFEYKDGCLFWKNPLKSSSVEIGSKAGWVTKYGYHQVNISSRAYVLSRIVFMYHHGYMPKNVDHKDRDKNNNRIENLRPATDSQNSRNRTSAKNSSSKYLGVQIYNKRTKSRPPLWLSAIKTKETCQLKLGVFESEEQAALEYNKFAVFFHGEFANLNIVTNRFQRKPKRTYCLTIKDLINS